MGDKFFNFLNKNYENVAKSARISPITFLHFVGVIAIFLPIGIASKTKHIFLIVCFKK